MADFKPRKKPKPIELSKFLGINEAVGETELDVGEFLECTNFRITKDYKLQKRPGHHKLIDFGTGDVRGIKQFEIADKNILIVCHGGKVYEYDLTSTTTNVLLADLITDGTVTEVGTITDAHTSIFWFESKIYFMNGTDYKEYDGTTYQDVVPYVPTIALNAPPTGGGTLFEEINLLTGSKKQTFVGDGTSTLYQLAETNIDADLLIITVDGVTKVENTDFTVNRTLGQVTFTVTPANEAAVSIEWVKEVSGNSDLIKNHKYAIAYGVENDTNLFIWGNENEKNRFRFSGILKAGYFPVNSYVAVGTDQFAITDLESQYQSLLVFKKNETKIVTPESNPNYATNTGLNRFIYPYRDLNNAVGNIAPNQVQLIENNPLSLDGFSMWLWSSITSVEDERNAQVISDRLKLTLQGLDLSQAITFDNQNDKEYFLSIDGVTYVWNYGNDTFYKYTNVDAKNFTEIEGQVYFGSTGHVSFFNSIFTADGETLGDAINCRAVSGNYDFDTLEYRKMMRDEWLSIKADTNTSVDITFVTNKKNESESKTITKEYKILDFNFIDFNDFSFLTNRQPQPIRLRAKIKKFTYLQVVLENNTNDETLTVLKLLMQAQTQSYSK